MSREPISNTVRGCLAGLGALALGTVAASSAPAQTTLVSHTGSNSPTANGWTQIGTEPVQFATAGPIDDEGTPAWYVYDASTAAGSTFLYSYTPSAAEVSSAASLGWRMSNRLRVFVPNDGADPSIYSEYAGAATGTRYLLAYGSDGLGNAIVYVNAAANAYNVGSGGYHTYDLVYDPAALSADLFVDGVERLSNIPTITNTTLTRMVWGSGSSATTGLANYNAVSLTVFPEPAALSVLLPAAFAVLGTRRRRERRRQSC